MSADSTFSSYSKSEKIKNQNARMKEVKAESFKQMKTLPMELSEDYKM
jgi:hypothetical protein